MLKPKYSLYQGNPDESEDLQQGDIIANNEKVYDIIKDYYPYNFNPKNEAFLIITQSCDLVRHDGDSCKASYINLAPVRPFDDVFLSLVNKVCGDFRIKDRYYSAKGKNRANELIESICSQNAWAWGVFFLHSNIDVEITKHSLALLQVSFAIPSNDSYDSFREFRRGRLDAAFQGRLGWLVGNLYSRIATPNYPKDRYSMIRDSLMSSDKENCKIPRWIKKKQLQKIKETTGSDAEDIEVQRIDELLLDYNPREPISKAIEVVLDTVKDVYARVSDKKLKSIESKLKGSVTFESLFD